MHLRNEETKCGLSFQVEGKTADGTPCKLMLNIAATSQEEGSRGAVERVIDVMKDAFFKEGMSLMAKVESAAKEPS